MVGSSARDAAAMKGFADKPLFSGIREGAVVQSLVRGVQPGCEPPLPDLQILPPWVSSPRCISLAARSKARFRRASVRAENLLKSPERKPFTATPRPEVYSFIIIAAASRSRST